MRKQKQKQKQKPVNPLENVSDAEILNTIRFLVNEETRIQEEIVQLYNECTRRKLPHPGSESLDDDCIACIEIKKSYMRSPH